MSTQPEKESSAETEKTEEINGEPLSPDEEKQFAVLQARKNALAKLQKQKESPDSDEESEEKDESKDEEPKSDEEKDKDKDKEAKAKAKADKEKPVPPPEVITITEQLKDTTAKFTKLRVDYADFLKAQLGKDYDKELDKTELDARISAMKYLIKNKGKFAASSGNKEAQAPKPAGKSTDYDTGEYPNWSKIAKTAAESRKH